jgi:hypothetical protein
MGLRSVPACISSTGRAVSRRRKASNPLPNFMPTTTPRLPPAALNARLMQQASAQHLLRVLRRPSAPAAHVPLRTAP